ncbi:MAG: SLC13 family permease [Thermoplasmatota archaeon]
MVERRNIIDMLRNDNFQTAFGLAVFSMIVLLASLYAADPKLYYGVAIVFLAVYMWLLTPISFIFSTFLIISVSVILGLIPPSEAFYGFHSGTLFFLMGAFVLAIAFEAQDLHKRVALTFLKFFGKSTKRFLLGIVTVGALLSMLMPSHGIAAIFIPILLGIYAYTKRKDILESNFAKATLLALSYGTSVGSIATFLGGARNILAVEIYTEYTGESISFIEWFVASIPVSLVMIVVVYLVLNWLYDLEDVDMENIRSNIKGELKKMGDIKMGEGMAAGFLFSGFIAWATVGQILGMGVVAVMLAFAIGASKIVTWEDVESRMPWGTLFLYVGAVSLSLILPHTGLLDNISSVIISGIGNNPVLMIAVFATLTVFLSSTMSNAAVTAVILPIGISAMVPLGFSVIVPVFTIALASGFAFLLPIGTPSAMLVYGTGQLEAKDFLKAGLLLNIFGILSFLTIGLAWWKILGYW